MIDSSEVEKALKVAKKMVLRRKLKVVRALQFYIGLSSLFSFTVGTALQKLMPNYYLLISAVVFALIYSTFYNLSFRLLYVKVLDSRTERYKVFTLLRIATVFLLSIISLFLHIFMDFIFPFLGAEIAYQSYLVKDTLREANVKEYTHIVYILEGVLVSISPINIFSLLFAFFIPLAYETWRRLMVLKYEL